jgi:hypothetical protein
MKTKKVFLAVIATAIIALLSACSVENAPNAANISEQNEPHITIGGVPVYAGTDGDFRSAIVNEIRDTRSMNARELQANGNHSANRIAEITEFYFPPAEIVGFELRRVILFEYSYLFLYAPAHSDKDFDIGFLAENSFSIIYRRSERYATRDIDDDFQKEAAHAEEEGWGYLAECGNMMYTEVHRSISARVGNTSVRIDVPPELNTFETLHDLALRVIETAEFVTV